MRPSSIAWTRIAWAVALAILALNVYRAATCSITIDEAFTYNRFVRTPYAQMVGDYDANQHVLYTLAAKVSVWLFGVSEFTLRLPGVLGGALYLWVALALARMLTGPRPALLLALGLLALNPLIVEHMSMARGYGAGLACWMLALYFSLNWPASPEPRELRLFALALAASVGFNLIFVPPGLALIAWCSLERIKEKAWWTKLINHVLVPGAVATFLLLALPMARCERGHFYLGEKTLWESGISLSRASLLNGMHWHPSWIPTWDEAVWRMANQIPWAAAIMLLLAIPAALHARAKRTGADRLGVALAAIGWMTLVMMVAGHHSAKILYPFMRTGIYWVPLLTLLGWWLCERYAGHWVARTAWCAAACAWLMLYILQIHPTYYPFFRSDAGNKHFIEVLRRMENSSRQVRLAANWQLEAGFNFYRYRYGLAWLEPVKRDSLERPADYYVLLPDDLPLIENRKLTVIERHAVSEAVLAKAPAASSP